MFEFAYFLAFLLMFLWGVKDIDDLVGGTGTKVLGVLAWAGISICWPIVVIVMFYYWIKEN